MREHGEAEYEQFDYEGESYLKPDGTQRVGNATPPLPYPVTQDLASSQGTVADVRLNGQPAYVLDNSQQPGCIGEAGDPCTLNGGNCPGVYVTSPAPPAPKAGEAVVDSNPPTTPQTAAEKGWWAKTSP